MREARRKRDKAKELLANDIDPGAQKKAAGEEAEAAAREQASPLIAMAGEWFACYISLGQADMGVPLLQQVAGAARCVHFPESGG